MKKGLLALFVFIILTLLLTYPIVLHLGTMVINGGDPLFSTWTLIWNVKTLISQPWKLFQANIFYPYQFTLAYSEHMLGNSILALPIYLITKGPLICYNLICLLTFVLAGFAAWALVNYLTGDWLAGVVAGIIFAFCPFRFSHLTHVHVLTSQWIPFALLYLHKYLDNNQKKKYLYLFALFFFWQFISSGHNGLFLAVTVFIFLIYFALIKKMSITAWLQLGGVLVIVGLLILPLYYPYIYLAKEFGFVRSLEEVQDYSPQLQAWLAAPAGNWLYGSWLNKLAHPEAIMFPGLLAVLLACANLWGTVPKIKTAVKAARVGIKVNRALNVLIGLLVVLILWVLIKGGFDTGVAVLGVKLKATSLERPFYVLLALLAVKIFIQRKRIWQYISKNRGIGQLYLVVAILSFLFCCGPQIRIMDKDLIAGPYSLLYRLVPGFQGLRRPGRWHVIFILALAVLAGLGFARLRKRFSRYRYKYLWVSIVPLLLVLEYASIPIHLCCYRPSEVPPVYQWLGEQDEQAVIIELPMPQRVPQFFQEASHLYWSLWHGKKMVNGYSGYSPPAYWPIAEKMADFPTDDTVQMLKSLGVKYVVIHSPELAVKLDHLEDDFKLSFKDADDCVYEVIGDPREYEVNRTGREIPQGDLILEMNYNPEETSLAIDGDLTTRWHSAQAQVPGMQVQIDLGKVYSINRVSLALAENRMDFPRGIALEVSTDGRSWRHVPLRFIYANYVLDLLADPRENWFSLYFYPRDARYLRVIQTGEHKVFYWSINEVRVFQSSS